MVGGMFGQNQLPGSSSNDGNTDNSMMQASKRNSTVGTAKPINGFIAVTKSDVDNAKEQLKKRVEQSRFFKQLLMINLKWQKVDIHDTKALTKWRVQTFGNLGKKAVIVAQGAARQQVMGQKIADRIQQVADKANSSGGNNPGGNGNPYQDRKDRAREKVRG